MKRAGADITTSGSSSGTAAGGSVSETWPDALRKLGKTFSILNTNLTFILSHSRSTLPTFEYFEKLIPGLTKFDLACIKYLLPADDVFFGYVDKEELFHEPVKYSHAKGYEAHQPDTIDKMYESIELANDSGPGHLLLFTFEDMKIDNIGAMANKRRRQYRSENTENNTFFNHGDLTIQRLTQPQLLNMIKSRKTKFERCVNDFLASVGDAIDECFIVDKLQKEVEIPQEPNLLDPVDMMNRRQRIASSGSSEVLTAEGMVDMLKASAMYKDQIEYEGIFSESRPASYQRLDTGAYGIHPCLIEAIKTYRGIDLETQLYTHQAEALESLLVSDVNHVIISTSTSSGKSLIYQIPILNEILWDIESNNQRARRNSTAIFIFPTKALAQDQKKHLQDLIAHLPLPEGRNIIVDTYDGDTDAKQKQYVRKFADIIFTNPDTIHASILPNHEGFFHDDRDNGWTPFLKCLKYVVVDEIHVYRGTFGIHVSYVMARLLRVLSRIETAAKLRFVSCSATVLNPSEHFRVVCSIPPDEEIVHISKDGSRSCEKRLLVWQPPPLMNKRGEMIVPADDLEEGKVNPRMVPRVSTVFESAKLVLSLLGASKTIKVIVFCPIRKVCEVLMKEIRNLLAQEEYSSLGVSDGDIMAYRGGYSKEDRRKIEQKMFSGEVRGLIATNALELGIDLADLDVVITCGFPLSKSNMHQQFGRAGRGKNSKGSLAVFVVGGVPLDQYYLKHPEELMDKSTYEDLCVKSLIAAQMHKLIMENHLQCAAFEVPIDIDNDAKWFCNYETTDEKRVQFFRDSCEKKLNKDKLGRYRTDPEYLPWPPAKVAIRAVESPGYAVVDITDGRNTIIEEVEESRTSFTLYEGGIFLHQGLPYLVKEFNTEKKFAKVQRVTVDWTTSQRDFTDVDPYEIEFIRCLESPMKEISDIPAFFGSIETTIVVFGFFKVNKKNEIIEAVEVKNPDIKYKSKGFWLDIPKQILEAISEKSLSPPAGIHAAQHAIMNILPLFISGATMNPNARYTSRAGEAELMTDCKAPEKEFAHRQTKRKRPARLIFYDAKGGPEGSGVSAKAFEYIDEILLVAFERVKNCECEWGCPQCVTAGFCKEMSMVMSKPAAYIILGGLVGRDIEELLDEVPDGPEPNMPDIKVETIVPATSVVRMSKDIEVIEEKPAVMPLKYIKQEK